MMRLQETFNRASLHLRLTVLLAGIVMVAVTALGAATLGAFDRKIAPELVNRSRLIGTIVRTEVQHALELGIQLEAMAGLERYLGETLSKFSEVDRIAIVTDAGQTVAQAERVPVDGASGQALATAPPENASGFRLPILEGSRVVGEVVVLTNPRQVQTRLREVFLDVIVIALVAILVAVELVLALIAWSVSAPLERIEWLLDTQAQGDFRYRMPPGGLGALSRAATCLNDHAVDLARRLGTLAASTRARFMASSNARIATDLPQMLRLSAVGDIRLVLFVFSVATEVAGAFMPVYAASASRPDWLSVEFAAALPLLCYLLVLALLAPVSGRLSERFGARRLFLASIVPASIALVGMAGSESVLGISLARSLLAACYATATIACQSYVLRAGGERNGLGGMSAFLAVIYAGVFCGSTLGGVLAGRFGYEATFLAGSLIALLSGVLGVAMMQGEAGDAVTVEAPPPVQKKPGMHGWRAGQIALMLGLAVPMNASTVVFIWYLTPLMLNASGAGPAEAARVVMLYYLAAIVFTPLVTRLEAAGIGLRLLVVMGAAGSALALFVPSLWNGPLAIVAAVAALGISHALMRAPMYVIALRMAMAGGGTLSPLRVVERLGAIVGLAGSALMLDQVGAVRSLHALGLVVFFGLASYFVVDFAGRFRVPSERSKT